MNKKTFKPNFIFLISAALTCLAIAVFSLMLPGSAFYSVLNDGELSSAIEEYEFVVKTDSSESFSFNLNGVNKPGASIDVPFIVSNGDSRIAQQYKVVFSSLENIPLTFSLQKGSESIIVTNGETEYQMLGNSSQTDIYILTVTWDAEGNSPSYHEEVDVVTVTVASEQIDPEQLN